MRIIGGLGFNAQQIGELLSIGGIGLGLMSLLVFPALQARCQLTLLVSVVVVAGQRMSSGKF